MDAQLLYEKTIASLKRNKAGSLGAEAQALILDACVQFCVMDEQFKKGAINERQAVAAVKALDSIVADWDTGPKAGASFWTEAMKIIKPLGETALKIVVTAAVNGAMARIV